MNKIKKILSAIVVTFIFVSCTGKEPQSKGTPEYIAEIEQWHQKRIERLKDENGWLTLVGLHWLKEGENSFGSDKNTGNPLKKSNLKKI